MNYPVTSAAALFQHVTTQLPKLTDAYATLDEKLVATRLKYRGRNGGATDELIGSQKTWISMIRRIVEVAKAGLDAGTKIAAMLTPGELNLDLGIHDLMDLVEWIQAYFRALITPVKWDSGRRSRNFRRCLSIAY